MTDVETYLVICRGHRCGALLDGSGEAGFASLRKAVRGSARAALVVTGCIQACALGPVMALAAGSDCRSRPVGPVTDWLGPVRSGEVAALAGWLTAGGAAAGALPAAIRAVRHQPSGPASLSDDVH